MTTEPTKCDKGVVTDGSRIPVGELTTELELLNLRVKISVAVHLHQKSTGALDILFNCNITCCIADHSVYIKSKRACIHGILYFYAQIVFAYIDCCVCLISIVSL